MSAKHVVKGRMTDSLTSCQSIWIRSFWHIICFLHRVRADAEWEKGSQMSFHTKQIKWKIIKNIRLWERLLVLI